MLPINNSPDIAALNFSAVFDLSGIQPKVVLTNTSAGPHLNNITWQYKVVDPTGTAINVDDADGNVSVDLPQISNQVPWSGQPFKVTLTATDSAATVYSLTKQAEICRPAGNKEGSGNNFGAGTFSVNIRCDKGDMYVEDGSNYTFKNLQPSAVVSRQFVLVYPPLEDVNATAQPVTVAATPNAILKLVYNGKNHVIYMTNIMKYDYGDDVFVIIKWKATSIFDVACNVDLCPLMCEYQKLIDKVKSGVCGDPAIDELRDKLQVIDAMIGLAMMMKTQPQCNYGDLAAYIQEIKDYAGFDCDCYSGSGNGINGSNANANITLQVNGCGDISGTAEINGSNIILNLKDKKYVVSIDEAAATTAFAIEPLVDAETCQITYVVSVDLDVLAADLAPKLPLGCCPVVLPVYVHATDPASAPNGCPNNIYGTVALEVYDPTDTNVIGVANSTSDLISIINNNADWLALGKAIDMGYCKVGFIFNEGVAQGARPGSVRVGAQGNSGGTAPYVSHIKDFCTNQPKQPADVILPATIYVRFVANGTRYTMRDIVDVNDMITKLNAHANKPAGLTFQATANDPSTIGILVTNTTANASAVEIWHDFFRFHVVGANHQLMNANSERVNYLNINTNTQLGMVCNVFGDGKPWMSGNYPNALYMIESATGLLKKIDVTSALNPFLSLTVQLPTFGGTAFTGLPLYKGQPSHWDTYVQDQNYYGSNFGDTLFILESASGTFIKYSMQSDTVVGSFQDARLIGKQPRVIMNDKLYFSHCGDYEVGTNQNSGVSRNKILKMDLTAFFAGGAITAVSVGADLEECWAITVRPGSKSLYLVFKSGTVKEYDASNDVVLNTFVDVYQDANGFVNAINALFLGNRLFVTCRGKGTWYADAVNNVFTTDSATQFEQLLGTNNTPLDDHLVLAKVEGKCYCILTFAGESHVGVARYTMDGEFMDITRPGTDGFYNVVLLSNGNSNIVTPNTFC